MIDKVKPVYTGFKPDSNQQHKLKKTSKKSKQFLDVYNSVFNDKIQELESLKNKTYTLEKSIQAYKFGTNYSMGILAGTKIIIKDINKLEDYIYFEYKNMLYKANASEFM